MKRVKILKSLPKSKTMRSKDFTKKSISHTPPTNYSEADRFKDQYLSYYDDIKVSTKRYDW